MIVICEECGKKYRIDAGKIKGAEAQFTCKSCNHTITVTNPDSVANVSAAATQAVAGVRSLGGTSAARGRETETDGSLADIRLDAEETRTPAGVGLRGRMILLFFAFPVTVIALSGWLYLWQLGKLSALITSENAQVIRNMAEAIIAERSVSVATQCRLYLDANPRLKSSQFNETEAFRNIAVQKVGRQGYTALYELPGKDGVWRTWAHVNPNIVNIDMSTLAGPMGNNFPGFWKIFSGVRKDQASRGYYTWQEKSGEFRDKFMVCTPVEGTPYVVAATTYLDEFTRPVNQTETRAADIAAKTRNIFLAILAGSVLFTGAIVLISGQTTIRRLKSLTETANRISIGELDVKIDIDSRDEIGDLAQAISRMQESIRLSIERLRRRRT